MKWLESLVEGAHEDLGDREREALYLRGVNDQQITEYQLGYVETKLPDADYPADFLEWWGTNKWQLDDCFVLPVTNSLGHVLGVQFRHVDRARKGYMDYFGSKEEVALFGLSQAMPHIWKTGSIWLVEGAFDLFPLQRHVPQVVATLHAGVSTTFLRLLKRLVQNIRFAYDNDKTGMDVSFEFLKEHRDHFKIGVTKFPRVPLPNGKYTKDPAELWEVWGDKKLGVYLHGLDS